MEDVIHAARFAAPDEAYLEAVARRRALSLSGEKLVAPDELWLPASENCNFRCVGCWREGMFKKSYLSLDETRRILENNKGHRFKSVSLTSGEGFLHPLLCDIIELCRETYPDAYIDMMSNGSIPPRGRFAEAVAMIDDLGLSIDGCTKETFENIRVGGNFERFVENARAVVEIRKETGNPRDLTFCFTAMTTNIAELPGVVDLAADIGVPMVYAQPMEVDAPDIFERIGAYHLTNMPLSEIYAISEDALARGKARGVTVDLAGILRPPKPGEKADALDPDQVIDADEIARDIRHCQYPYTEAFQYLRSGDRFRVLPCCYMSEGVADTMAER